MKKWPLCFQSQMPSESIRDPRGEHTSLGEEANEHLQYSCIHHTVLQGACKNHRAYSQLHRFVKMLFHPARACALDTQAEHSGENNVGEVIE